MRAGYAVQEALESPAPEVAAHVDPFVGTPEWSCDPGRGSRLRRPWGSCTNPQTPCNRGVTGLRLQMALAMSKSLTVRSGPYGALLFEVWGQGMSEQPFEGRAGICFRTEERTGYDERQLYLLRHHSGLCELL